MKRKLKVLVSAYACEPGKGSEPGVGWNWVNELARQHEVWVVTRANNRDTTEAALTGSDVKNLHFVYHDLPKWSRFWKKGPFAIYPYYLLWHATLGVKLRNLHSEVGFDVFHHLTFAADWLPNFLSSQLDIPTVVGPLAGYETADAIKKFIALPHLVSHYLKVGMRQIFIRFRTKELRNFSLVISNNENYTRYYMKHIGVKRCINISTQGYSPSLNLPNIEQSDLLREQSRGKSLNITMGGRMKYWKGYDVAIRVFAELKKRGINFQVTLIGSGASWYERRILKSIEGQGVSDCVNILKTLPRDIFLERLRSSDLFLYPTFYGSGDAIMLEAIMLNVPVVCFPSAGAKEIVGEDYPYMSGDFSVESLAEIIVDFVETNQAFSDLHRKILTQQSLSQKMDLLTDAYQRLIQNGVSGIENKER